MQVFWFDKIRMYQGYAQFNPTHERVAGSIVNSSSFIRLKASKEAEIKAWEKTRASTNADSRLINRRYTSTETAATTAAIRTIPVSYFCCFVDTYV